MAGISLNGRLRAVCDLVVADVRESAGLHQYDGVVQDLSPDGVKTGLARLRDARQTSAPERDAHDEAHLAAFEDALAVAFGDLQDHRRNPYHHLANLELACYDREYAPADERAAAKRRHLEGWPDGVDAAIASLDRVPAPVAQGLVGAARGLAADLDGDDSDVARRARDAHQRFVAHLEKAAADGDPDPALGGAGLAKLLGTGEAMSVDLGRLAAQADSERDRLRAMLDDACAGLRPGVGSKEIVDDLLRDHPDAGGVISEAQAQVDEVIAFTRERDLAPGLDGECRVGPAPPSRRWAMAMMSWAAPYEPDAASWYHVTPPDSSWPVEQQEEWLQVFSRTTLPAITVHEVAPGHFAHGRALRRAPSDVRRTLFSMTFAEGWAHYVEEMCLDEGFRAGDPRYAIGVAIEGLVRVTRLAVSIGVHTGSMSMDDAARRFSDDAFLAGPAARSEAARSTFDPTYGRYTWGKLEILRARDEAEMRWGKKFSLPRFHAALLELGSPPLGLIGAAIEST